VVCVSECDQVKVKTLYTCCEQVGRKGKDYEKKYTNKLCSQNTDLSNVKTGGTYTNHFALKA
jgi:hypothetical protein